MVEGEELPGGPDVSQVVLWGFTVLLATAASNVSGWVISGAVIEHVVERVVWKATQTLILLLWDVQSEMSHVV